ncbi:hypothetical protein [Ectothiorhodospira sp. PHS-1]|uniref:hypothetical protein n=1 Tax=Ectothiorhodospira sp. PHS-1 TaxID=519989 RepID=UPI001145956D|nr:hypothetical protein [Ectothiorhodospira sp. PHS-1]
MPVHVHPTFHYPTVLKGNLPAKTWGYSSISVHASPEVRKLYYDHMESKDRDETRLKHLLLEMTVAANKHIASIEHEIDQLLK